MIWQSNGDDVTKLKHILPHIISYPNNNPNKSDGTTANSRHSKKKACSFGVFLVALLMQRFRITMENDAQTNSVPFTKTWRRNDSSLFFLLLFYGLNDGNYNGNA